MRSDRSTISEREKINKTTREFSTVIYCWRRRVDWHKCRRTSFRSERLPYIADVYRFSRCRRISVWRYSTTSVIKLFDGSELFSYARFGEYAIYSIDSGKNKIG